MQKLCRATLAANLPRNPSSILSPIAGMGEPTRRVFGRDGRQSSSYRFYQCLARPCPFLAHELLDLAESFLYGIQVRRVGRQEHELRSSGFDELLDPIRPMRPQPI